MEQNQLSNQERIAKVKNYLIAEEIPISSTIDLILNDIAEEVKLPFSADIYFKNDKGDFENDLVIKNEVKIDIAEGFSEGTHTDTYTYYGDIDVAFNQEIILFKDGEFLEKMEDTRSSSGTNLLDDTDFCIVVKEVHSWNTKTKKDERNLSLLIFYPKEVADEEEVNNG